MAENIGPCVVCKKKILPGQKIIPVHTVIANSHRGNFTGLLGHVHLDCVGVPKSE